MTIFIIFMIVLFFAGLYMQSKDREKEEQRKKQLIKTYGDNEVSQALIDRQIFRGMQYWQLMEVWGPPDEKIKTALKTKNKETWMYDRAGRGYLNQVYLEDGVVVGWKQRGN